ncbi:MAG: MFS transporter, partial [Nitrospirota bacterium]
QRLLYNKLHMKKYKPLLPFFICYFLLLLVNWMIMAFLPIYLKSVLLSDEKTGIIIGIYSISSLIMVLPAGLFSDFFSPKKIAISGAFLFMLYCGGLYKYNGYYQLAVIALIGGTGNSILNIILYSLFLKVMGLGVRGKKIALFQVGAYLGFGAGPLIGGLIVQRYSFDMLFISATGLSVILFALIFTLKDCAPIRFSLKDYRVDLKDSRIFLLLLIVLMYATHFGVEQTSFSLLMKEKLDFSGERIGLVFFILGVWMAALAPVAGHSFDRSNNVIVILITGLLSSSLFQVITGYVSNFEQLIVIRILHTMGDALVIFTIGILTSEFFPEQRLGGHAGVVHITRTIGIFLGNIGSGYFNHIFSYDRSLIINGAYIFIFTLMTLRMIRKKFTL